MIVVGVENRNLATVCTSFEAQNESFAQGRAYTLNEHVSICPSLEPLLRESIKLKPSPPPTHESMRTDDLWDDISQLDTLKKTCLTVNESVRKTRFFYVAIIRLKERVPLVTHRTFLTGSTTFLG